MSLAHIQQQLSHHVHTTGSNTPLGSLGVFHCQRPQLLHQIPIHMPTLVLVVNGQKKILRNQTLLTVDRGELLLVPGNCILELSNHPPVSGEYYSLVLSFSPQSIKLFTETYAAQLSSWQQPLLWQSRAPEVLYTVLNQWVGWCQQQTMNPLLVLHRQVEILLILAQHNLAGNLCIERNASWKQRIVQLLHMDLSRDWQIDDICPQLGVSEATLRRKLQAENTSFRYILEETRLIAGLSLLQETFWPVQRIAHQVGYQSQSRFAERFKKQFGITPSDLRRDRVIADAEQLTV